MGGPGAPRRPLEEHDVVGLGLLVERCTGAGCALARQPERWGRDRLEDQPGRELASPTWTSMSSRLACPSSFAACSSWRSVGVAPSLFAARASISRPRWM
jgi:hypothetical protein